MFLAVIRAFTRTFAPGCAAVMESMQRIKSLELLVENDPTSDLPVNSTVLSYVYVNKFQDGHVELTYVKGHTGHELGVCELPHLSIPASIRETQSWNSCRENNGR